MSDLPALVSASGLATSDDGHTVWTRDDVSVSCAAVPAGVRLTVRQELTGPPAGEVVSALTGLSLLAAGDTTISVDGPTIEVSRTLVDPGAADLRDGVADVSRTLLAARASAESLLTAYAASEPAATIPPPILGAATLTVRFDHTVQVPQLGWPQPDGSQPATAQLRPGEPYAVVERRDGGWARVRNRAGGECFTDGAGLVPLPPTPDQPQEAR